MDPEHYDDWVTIHRKLGHVDGGELREGFRVDQTLCLHHANFKVSWELRGWTSRATPSGGPRAGRVARADRGTARAARRRRRTRFDYHNEYDQPGGILGRMASRVLVQGAAEREARPLAAEAQGAASRTGPEPVDDDVRRPVVRDGVDAATWRRPDPGSPPWSCGRGPRARPRRRPRSGAGAARAAARRCAPRRGRRRRARAATARRAARAARPSGTRAPRARVVALGVARGHRHRAGDQSVASTRPPASAAAIDGSPSPQPSSITRWPVSGRRAIDAGERERARPQLGPVGQELLVLERLLAQQRVAVARREQRSSRPGKRDDVFDEVLHRAP